MSPVATNLSYLGVAKESSRGTGVSPTFFLPVTSIEPEDVPKWLRVTALKGSMAKTFGYVQGLRSTTFGTGGPAYADSFGWPLMGILGDVTTSASRTVSDGVTNATTTVTSATANFTASDVGKNISGGTIPAGTFIASRTNSTTVILSAAATGSASGVTLTIGAPQTHVGSLLNSTPSAQPTSHTLTDFYAITQARQYAGIQWVELELKFNVEGLLEWTAKAQGLVPSLPVAQPVGSWTTVLPMPTWQGIATIGGTVMAKIGDGTVNLKREVALIPGMNGTQQYAQVFLGPLETTYKFSAYIDDDTEYNRMSNNTQPSVDLNWSSGVGASMQQIRMHMSQVAYLKAKPNRGKPYVQIDVESEAVANTTDIGSSGGFGMVQAAVGNALASGTYV
jgi:Phage tail tube protein